MSHFASPRVGWSLQLEGDNADLNDCVRLFDSPDGPTVLQEESRYVLRASDVDKHPDAESAYREAETTLAQMNGARLLHHPGKPVRLSGSMVSHHENGSRAIVLRAEAATIVIRGGIAKLHGPGGSHEDPSLIELKRSRNSAKLAEALIFFGRADNWFDLYKVYEVILSSVRGSKLSSAGLIESNKTEGILKQTMNKHRHAHTNYRGAVLSFEEAKALIAAALKQLLATS